MLKKWQILPKISTEFRRQFPEIPEVVLQLLHNRGLTAQKAMDEFLNPDYSQMFTIHFFSRHEKAVERCQRHK